MGKDIFQYRDYKAYLQDWIEAQPKHGRGLRAKLATAMQCNTTYVAQVLNGGIHLSAEQGERASQFLGLRYEERIFFQLLIQLARAGTQSLRALVLKQVDQLLEQQLNLKNRLEYKKTLSIEDQLTYYSAWYYAAIHVVLSIPVLQTREAIAQYFGLAPRLVSDVLNYLVTTGLAIEESGRFKTGPVNIHLPKDSPAIAKLHANWRVQAIDAIHQKRGADLHYSSVVAIDAADESKVRAILVKAIEEVRAVVKESKENAAYCYCLDFFTLERER